MDVTTSQAAPWLLLTFKLTKKNASLRVAVWRKLQVFGALPFTNSGYLLPNSAQNQERFEWLATTIRNGDGEASVVEVQSIDNVSKGQLIRQFSEARRRDYDSLLRKIRAAMAGPKRQRLAAMLPRLRKQFQAITEIDFFGGPMKEEVERLLKTAQDAQGKATPDSQAAKVSRKEFQGKVWVTRPRPGVDRVMSAWLIRKFIDPRAKFVFATQQGVPVEAVRYDMYEGGFGHSGENCTFETLVKSFRIREKRVDTLAQIVHDADLFDGKFGRQEGFGIDEVMKGWARQGLSDRNLLERGMQLAEGMFHSIR